MFTIHFHDTVILIINVGFWLPCWKERNSSKAFLPLLRQGVKITALLSSTHLNYARNNMGYSCMRTNKLIIMDWCILGVSMLSWSKKDVISTRWSGYRASRAYMTSYTALPNANMWLTLGKQFATLSNTNTSIQGRPICISIWTEHTHVIVIFMSVINVSFIKVVKIWMRNKLLRFIMYFSHVCLSVLMSVGVICSGVKCLAFLVDCMKLNSSSFW